VIAFSDAEVHVVGYKTLLCCGYMQLKSNILHVRVRFRKRQLLLSEAFS